MPMTDQSRIELPGWLPWATTACLAAMVACLGELWLIERTRSELLREQRLLADAALKGAQNQLEAERIVNGTELAGLRAAAPPGAGLRVALLLPAAGAPANAAAPVFGVVAWDPAVGRALVRLNGIAAQDPGRDYQLWLAGPGLGKPVRCALFHLSAGDDKAGTPMGMADAIAPGCRFILVDGPAGGTRTLEEAEAGASIVLASVPIAENISSR
ncbi:MAG TPA: anti-sigma factor [Opitutaceae bacterium]|nr:anti-sigma factor [Opitutaceae bacterium]